MWSHVTSSPFFFKKTQENWKPRFRRYIFKTMTQVLLNSLISGLLLALVATGFGIIFHVTKVFHLAHAGVYVLGTYLLIAIERVLPFPLAVIGVLLLIGLIAWLIERFIYFPLYESKANQMISLISALGVNVVLINMIALFFGNEVQRLPQAIEGIGVNWANEIIMTNARLFQAGISMIVILAMWLILRNSGLSLQVRAIADDDQLAGILGVDVPWIRTIALVIGSWLAVIVSVLQTLDIGIDPYAGVSITLTGAVVALLSGTVGLRGIVAVALFIALLQSLTEWYWSAQWKEGLTFLLLLGVMLFRTEGILTYALRKDG